MIWINYSEVKTVSKRFVSGLVLPGLGQEEKWLAYNVCLEYYSTHFKYGKQEYLMMLFWSGVT